MSKKRDSNFSKRSKSSSNLARTRKKKEGRQYILIVVEGKTEYNYLKSLNKSLKLPTIKVEVVDGKGGSPLVIVEKACDLCKGKNYEKIFCVFDGDKPEEYKKALKEVKKNDKNDKNDITAIPSIPCFELWFLLHYRYTTQHFCKCNDVIDQINYELRKEDNIYDKNMDMYSLLEKKLDKAIARAKRLEEYHKEEQTLNIDCANPLTKVHQLVKYLQDQKDYKTTKN
ncbi:MAG: RloB domain-containing protein [Moorea sp. SIO1F2]|uniref:RloB family protein n=1 Tax=Moorena sp. SIO1F2 TaxID=2607819 RepID=UPI0013BB9148|nr:RloB family protein [Moorena sp. SIO1F2]NET85048.1 RloB domain-containing protein [Moorena sp. SIO1F2]